MGVPGHEGMPGETGSPGQTGLPGEMVRKIYILYMKYDSLRI